MSVSLPRTFGRSLLLVLAIAFIALSLWRLHAASDGVATEAVSIDGAPATIFRPQGQARGPVILIAHGFAGSQQLMQSFGYAFARNGYTAVTFDFPGHGRNPRPCGAASPKSQARHAISSQRLRVRPPSLASWATDASRCWVTPWPRTSSFASRNPIHLLARLLLCRCSRRSSHATVRGTCSSSSANGKGCSLARPCASHRWPTLRKRGAPNHLWRLCERRGATHGDQPACRACKRALQRNKPARSGRLG